jgi:hypothetical protein
MSVIRLTEMIRVLSYLTAVVWMTVSVLIRMNARREPEGKNSASHESLFRDEFYVSSIKRLQLQPAAIRKRSDS